MASTIPGHTLRKTPHPGDQLLTMDRIAHVVGVPIATSRHVRHVCIGPRRFRIGPSVRYPRAEVLLSLAGVEPSENAGAFVDPPHTRVTTCECATTLLDGQTQLRPRTLERQPAGAAEGRSLPAHGEPPW